MTEPPPSQRPRRLALVPPLIIAGIVVVIVLGAVLSRSLDRDPAPVVPAPAPALPTPEPQAAAPMPPPPLGRADLIRAAESAASAYASGAVEPAQAEAPLIGRPFVVRLSFACDGPQATAAGAQAYASFDAKNKSLKLAAQPIVWTTLPLIQTLASAADIDAVEGFWLARPWSLAGGCPPRRDTPIPATPTPPSAQTLGLAQIFDKSGSRVSQRAGRPYETVVKVAEDDPTMFSRTYRLVLRGRIVGYADGRAVHCWSETPAHRPTCLFAVAFDRITFEDEAGKALAEWTE